MKVSGFKRAIVGQSEGLSSACSGGAFLREKLGETGFPEGGFALLAKRFAVALEEGVGLKETILEIGLAEVFKIFLEV